ncbi:MAG: L-glutamate gamma-semialdehyde dehydrogenase [Cytophagales bacterium]
MRPLNEPIFDYLPGSEERLKLESVIKEFKGLQFQIPMFINGLKIKTETKVDIVAPHDFGLKLGTYFKGSQQHAALAIQSALGVHKEWSGKTQEERNNIFLKAAWLAKGEWRYKLNAATMLCQSKNVYQAEIDSACELIDFLNFNVFFANQIQEIQPTSNQLVSNRLEFRALEGFVFAVTPFNFTAISCNLPAAPALLGNTVVWKPADSQIYSAYVVMQLLKEAGLPDGVINLVYGDGPSIGEVVFSHPYFAGLHFTGSTTVFDHLWKTISENLYLYKNYPRIVGETGGKNFLLAHNSAVMAQVCTALIRGAFEYQGQKCSATSRAYIPMNLWNKGLKDMLVEELRNVKMGSVEDYTCLVNAVIDEKAFNKITGFIKNGIASNETTLLAGGEFSKKEGYFISPTVFVTTNPYYETMVQEIFGPVLTIYVFQDDKFDEVLSIVDQTSDYGLTGAIFCQDEAVIESITKKLNYAAGNFYINDKSTGAVVDQQPFGGARLSGTNDKAGSVLNLLRWVSPRNIKRNFSPPTHWEYPYMK